MTVDEKWLHKNKDHGMMSAAASLGLILLWDVDEGLSQVRPSGSVPCAANK
jgi:26S proteasome regulatory subunit N1